MNPYTPRATKLFYGRETILRGLLRDEESGQSQVVLGGRRCGKTRLLERIERLLRGLALHSGDAGKLWTEICPDASGPLIRSGQPVHWPVLVSLQGHAFTSVAQVLTYFAKVLVASGPPVAEELLILPSAGFASADDAEGWLKKLDGELARVGLGGVALLIDEIEEILDRDWCTDLLSVLRNWNDRTFLARLWFVLVGSERLDRYRHPVDSSPALNVSRRTRLPGLDYASRRRMIVEPFVAAGRLPPADAVQRAVDLAAAGNVWLLTLLLEQLFNQDASPSEAATQQARQLILEDQGEVFERWASAFGPQEWQLYATVAQSGRIPTSAAKQRSQLNARMTLEYHALVHRPAVDAVELGPEIFRDWAESAGHVRQPFQDRQRAEPTDGIPPGTFRYEVALSYASSDLTLAREVNEHLSGITVFYDREQSAELWGVDLLRCLPHVFDREARLVVLLVSSDYAQRVWPRLEAREALLKAAREGWEAVVVVSIDGGKLADYPETVRCLPVTSSTAAAQIALEVRKRLQGLARR